MKQKKLSRREKGFTLVELLVVVAILGVLAAVVVPSVGNLLDTGKSESAQTELKNVQLAVAAMLADNGLTQLDGNYPATPGNGTQDMTTFLAGSGSYNVGQYLQETTTEYYYAVAQDGTVYGPEDGNGSLVDASVGTAIPGAW